MTSTNRVAVFIDNSNVFKNLSKIRQSDSDWETFYNPFVLAEKLSGSRDLVHVGFYCVRPPIEMLESKEGAYWATNSYYDTIAKLPKTIVRYGKLEGPPNNRHEKNVDTQLTADLVRMAAKDEFDTAIIVSNDGDFVASVEAAKDFGKRVEIGFFRGSLSNHLDQVSDLKRRIRKSHFERMAFSKSKAEGE